MQEMKRLRDKVAEMQKQRQMFEQQFRDDLLKDDLTATLVTHADKNQEVRQRRIVRYLCMHTCVFSFRWHKYCIDSALTCASSALTLLVGCQEEHPACRN